MATSVASSGLMPAIFASGDNLMFVRCQTISSITHKAYHRCFHVLSAAGTGKSRSGQDGYDPLRPAL